MTASITAAICPVCSGRDFEAIIRIPDMPLVCNRLFDTPEEVAAAASGDLELVQCQICSHIFNATFDLELLSYADGYENSLHHSPTFAGFADSLARELVERYDLHGWTVVEIGCGDGRFLMAICEAGGNSGYGFDPSQKDWTWDSGSGAKLQVTSGLFSPATSNLTPKLICCRHVLEHLDEPAGLLNALRVDRFADAGTIFYFEVPNGNFVMHPQGVWDHIYEHYSCFTPESLAYLFQSRGFRVLQTGTSFADQFLWVHARLGNGQDSPRPTAPGRDEARRTGQGYEDLINTWRERLTKLKNDGKAVAVWGAGSKGVTFVNLMDPAGAIDAVVDINPSKQGRFVPGTRHRVIAPEKLRARPPNVVIAMNPVYTNEIAKMIHALDIEAEIVTPV